MSIRLKPLQLIKLREKQPHFEKVEGHTGVPWEAIAAIWYRESFSVTNPKTLGGPFQFDPPPSPARLKAYLDKYTKLGEETKKDLVALGINNFYSAAYFAACHAREHCSYTITPDAKDEAILDLFWGYNGKKFGAPQKSFYVYNGFDDQHHFKIQGTLPDGKGGRKRIRDEHGNPGVPDLRPGAFIVYKQLKGEIV